MASKFFQRLSGALSKNISSSDIGKFTGSMSTYIPTDSFPSQALTSYYGGIPKDNWGSFGTFIGDVAKDVYDQYEEKPKKKKNNASIPETTGEITKYAPALPITKRRQKIKYIPIKKTANNSKSVNKMTGPKKKRIIRRKYKTEI